MSLLNQVLQDLDQRTAPTAQRPLHVASQAPPKPAAETPEARPSFDGWRWASWTLLVIAALVAAWVHLQPAPEAVVIAPAQSRPVAGPTAVAERAAVPETTPDVEEALSPKLEPLAATVPETSTEADPRDAEPEHPTVAGQTTPSEFETALSLQTILDATAPVEQTVTSEPVLESMPPGETAPTYLPLRGLGPAQVKVQHGDGVSANELARRQIETGDLSAAEQTVAMRLAAVPGDREARELLVGLMLRGGRHAQALETIDTGLRHHPDHRAFLLIKARLLAQVGDLTAAVGVLADRLPPGGQTQEALQMLGALYQQQGRYDEAVATYRRLIGLAPDAGPAWVGLAIGLDSLGDPTAREAYARALALGGLPGAAERYARSRLAALEADRG